MKPTDDAAPTRGGPLSGIRVLDLSHVVSGPLATMMLADLGADVIKVERPGVGDGARLMDKNITDSLSGYFMGINKNKRSIAIDLSSPDGQQTVKDLAASADVFVENFRPGAAERLGLGYGDIAAVRPDIVYCSITGFGTEGELRGDVAYDIVAQALSGVMAITGEPGHPPTKCGAPVADISAAMFAALGIVAALHHRERTGEGQHVGTSLLGAAVTLVAPYVTSHAVGTEFHRVGSAHNTLAPYQVFEGSDGAYFVLAAGNDSFFFTTLAIMDRPDLAADADYASNALRIARRDELAAKLQVTFRTRPAAEWVGLLGEAGVPVSPIQEIADLADDPQLRANGYIVDVEQPSIGTLPMVVTPLAFSASEPSAPTPVPLLNEHEQEILAIARGETSWA